MSDDQRADPLAGERSAAAKMSCVRHPDSPGGPRRPRAAVRDIRHTREVDTSKQELNHIMRTRCLLLLLGAAFNHLHAAEPAQPNIVFIGQHCAATDTPARKTTVRIVGEDFHINGQPTYAGRMWKGHRIEGLLLNSRMVQAIFDDLNPETAKRWAYADTGKWDAERNVREFIAAMPDWKRHGLLAVTVNFQGGSPEGYSGKQTWETGAFTADGGLRPAFAERMRRVLDAADEQGMVVILGYFYFGQSPRFAGDEAVVRATDEATRWLLDGGWRNVLVEINNETNPSYKPPILRPDRVSELIQRVRARKASDGHTLLVGTSFGGCVVPPPTSSRYRTSC